MADNLYDYPIPTVNGQQITVYWLQADPRRIYRLLNTLVQRFLIGRYLLRGRVDLTGSGSAIYEIAEGIFADLSSATVPPLTQYPLTTTTPGTLAAIKPLKDGLDTMISDEDVAHNRIDKVLRDLTKIANTLVLKADGLMMAAITSLVTQTQSVTNGDWTTNTANMFRDIMLARAKIIGQNKGYNPDTVAMTFAAYAYVISSPNVVGNTAREGDNAVTLTGNMTRIGGVTFLATNNMPSGFPVLLADSTQLGSQAWEELGGGYQGSANPDSESAGVQTKRMRDDEKDGWRVRGRLVQAPMIQEPGAGCFLTGTGMS